MFLAALGATVLAAASGVVTLHVSVVDPRGARAASAVVAEPVGSTDRGAIRRTVAAPRGSAALALEPGVWSLRATADQRWGEPGVIHVQAGSPGPVAVTLTLWPVGRLRGSVRAPAGQTLPEHLALRLHRGLTPSTFARAQPLDSIVCPIHDRRWSCEVPALTPLDVQVDAAPLGPAYLWHITVAADGTLDTGELRLFRGSSLAGWVVTPDGSARKPPAAVQLTAPDGAPVKAVPGGDWQLGATTDARGFFQLGPVPPGTYHVVATAGMHLSEPAQVKLATDVEERLRAALEPKPPATLRLAVEPAYDPDGQPWSVRLLAPRGQHSGHLVVGGERVAGDGTWSRAGLPTGRYRLMLMSASGNTWHDQELELVPEADVERIAIRMLRVEGSLTLGTEPLAGRVRLSDEAAGVHVRLHTNEEGVFSGPFPSVDLEAARWVADVESSTPRLRRTLSRLRPESGADAALRFDLRLGEGAIEGIVVDERGAPVAALVLASEHDVAQPEGADTGLIEARASEADGTFRIPGLAAGEYRLYASGLTPVDGGYAAVSEVVSVKISAGKPASVRLVLTTTRNVEGRVTTPVGAGVAGATVIVVSETAPDVLARPRTTDAAGRFDVRVPAGTQRLVVSVWAVGVGRRTLVRALPEHGLLEIELDPAAAGLLIFDLGEPAAGLDSAVLLHDGALEGLRALADWAGIHGEPAAPGLLRVPLMAPGEYHVCRIRSAVEQAALMAGTLPPGRCNSGQLAPAGELRLRVPPPPPGAAPTQ